MRFCVAMAFQSESHFLRLHLPALHLPASWGLVGLDGGSTDDSALVIAAAGGVVHQRPFDWHFARHMNALMAACEAEGYDVMLRLDPDELVFPAVFEAVEWMFTEATYDAVALPRYGFIADRQHHNPRWHPDYQVRGLRLGVGLRYDGAVHEQVNYAGRRWVKLDPANPYLHIYHYGWLLPLDVRRAREARYAALVGGNADPMAHLVDGYPYSEPFTGDQPLSVEAIGACAPWA